ncbi:MAG: hypothetical protein EU541_06900 [Promethearchaeota archaeon]|nr:MAG: hypothetical protein EU541_06900 [Candidatus Lokiarchaeota archaeon]
MSNKLDSLFKKFEDVFIAREQEIKEYLLKYKKDDFQSRDVIDVRRMDATERLKTSGFRNNLSMWQNFYKNVIVSSCIELEGEKKRYDYKFYFTEEKIDAELLEQIEKIISDANKLKMRMHFDEALEKVDLIEDMVKDKQDKYFNEQLRLLRIEIKNAKKQYNKKQQEIKRLELEIENSQESNNVELILKNSQKIVELAKSVRDRNIQKQYENLIEEITVTKKEAEIEELKKQVEERKDNERYNVAIEKCNEIIELADSINDNETKKQYKKEIETLEKELEYLKEDQIIQDKINALNEELSKKQEESNYKEALEIVDEIIKLANLSEDEKNLKKYTTLKEKIIIKLEEQKEEKLKKEKEEEIQELEKNLEEKQKQAELVRVIEIAENIITIASEINDERRIEQYKSFIEKTQIEIKKRDKEKEFQERVTLLENKLEENRENEKWENSLKNCRDILYLAKEKEDKEIISRYTELKELLKEKIAEKKKASVISKNYDFNWDFDASEPILTCSVLKKKEEMYFVYGGHNRTLYFLDKEANILNTVEFDGWVRCSFPIDSDGDGADEILVGTGDGDMLVLQIDDKKNKLVGIFHNKIKGKILCCTAGDINVNGIINYVYGGEGKKVHIYEGLISEKPQFILYYPSWVTACTIGALKLPDSKKPQNFLLVGTLEGFLQLIQIDEKELEILWQKSLGVKINDIKLGDVFNDGYNEICIACDDSSIKILNSAGTLKKTLEIKEGRPLALNIDDIDDDKAQELIVGGSHGTLSVFQNENINSIEIKPKWKTTGKTSIQSICTAYNSNTGTKQVIYGGYDRMIKNITDFDWGKKKAIEIPRKKKLKLPAIKPKQEEYIVPTNLRELIIQLFKDKVYFNLDVLIKDLVDFGYEKEKIEKVIKNMRENSSIIKEKLDIPAWILNEDKVNIDLEKGTDNLKSDENNLNVKADTSKRTIERIAPKKEKKETDLRNAIIEILKKEEIVDSKSDLIQMMVDLGYEKEEVDLTIDSLNDQNIITYSRSKPQGWRIS